MAEGYQNKINGFEVEHIGTQKIFDYTMASTTPVGCHFIYAQYSPDNPFTGNVSYAIVNKIRDDGGYSQAILWGSTKLYVSQIYGPSSESITWYEK